MGQKERSTQYGSQNQRRFEDRLRKKNQEIVQWERQSSDYLMASFVFFFLKSFRSSQSPTAVESGGQGISIYIPIKITNPGREFP